jgi:hypothetical protein
MKLCSYRFLQQKEMSMEKRVRISTVKEHELHRIADIAELSPSERVLMILEMQKKYFNWNDDTKIKRVAFIRRLS